MEPIIRILHLEDDPAEAELVQARLEETGLSCRITLARTRDEFERILGNGGMDIILADHRLPMYNGMSALRLANDIEPDIPFIFVSGTLGEEAAIEALTQGATDYVLKQNLSRLAPAIQRALQEVRTRRGRKQTEKALKESEARFRTIVKNSTPIIFLTDQEGKVLLTEGKMLAGMGLKPGDLVGQSVFDIWQDYPAIVNGFRTALSGKLFEGVIELDELIFEVFYSPHKDSDGNIIGVIGMGLDITERKQADREHLENLRFFENMDKVNRAIQGADDLEKMMGDLLDVVLSTFDCDRAYVICPCDPDAKTWEVIIQREKPEYPGAMDLDLELPTISQVADTLRVLLTSESPVAFAPGSSYLRNEKVTEKLDVKSALAMAIHPKTGSPWQFGIQQCSHARVWTDKEKRLFQEIGRRIADGLTSMLISRGLRESEQRYRTIFENSPVSIWEEDFSAVKNLFENLRKQGVSDIEAYFGQHPETVLHCAESAKIIDVNQAAISLHGATDKVELIAGLVKTFTPESFDTFRQELVCLWNGDTEMTRDAVVKTLAGNPHYVTVCFSVCPGYEQTLSKVLVSLIDITDRKRAEAEVERLKNHLANIFDSAPLVLVGIDSSDIVTQWNRQAMKMTGVAPSETVGRTVADLLPDFFPWFAQMRSEVNRHHPASMERLLIEKEGRRQFYDLLLYPLIADGVEGVVLCIEDVTEQTRIQEVMIQTEKMMSLGGLAAGMAHEINNPLGIITQAIQNIERRVSYDLPVNRKVAEEIGMGMDEIKRYFEKRQILEFIRSIREASVRASRIIANVLRFSRRPDETLVPFSIPEVIEQALELAVNDYDLKKKYDFRSIDIRRDYMPDMPQVPMIAVELEQVLLNLFKNAAQAMMENPPDRKPRIVLRIRCEERYAVIEVMDNGPGIAKEARNRVFEPFFTTKEPGVGTGLGLSVAYTIITRNHKGLMEVSSVPGQGACFTVRLPLMEMTAKG